MMAMNMQRGDATEKQIGFIKSLFRETRGSEAPETIYGLSRHAASVMITELLRQRNERPVVQAVQTPKPENVTGGRYAVQMDGKLHFFRVDCPTTGKWAGFTFVKEQSSDEFYSVKGARRNLVLAEIAKDAHGAMLLYGKELGVCGHCGRTLTDETSRAIGIGPICLLKMNG